MLLTDDQLQRIRDIIRRHHAAFIINTIGPAPLSPTQVEDLKARGLYDPHVATIEDSYVFGQLLTRRPDLANLPLKDLRKELVKVGLSAPEQRAVAVAQHRAAQHVTALGNRIEQAVNTEALNADAEIRRQGIRDLTAEAIAKRKTAKQLKLDLGNAQGDWHRDWDRIAATEKHNAMQEGVADSIRGKYGDEQLVAKIPMPDACEHCKRLYLDRDGLPRVFPLSELDMTNVGRKKHEWQPVVGATHPWCQCQLVRVPKGWGFDEDGNLVPGGRAELERSDFTEPDLVKSYKLARKMKWNGLEVSIETDVGQYRHWGQPGGKQGKTLMKHPYGYVNRTLGADGDHYDVYVGPNEAAPFVYVVHQKAPPHFDQYDEDKGMIGFDTQAEAVQAFLDHYDDPRFLGEVSVIPVEEWKKQILGGNQTARAIPAMHVMEKGKAEPVGTERTWKNGKRVRKEASGKWVEVTRGRSKAAPEQSTEKPTKAARPSPELAAGTAEGMREAFGTEKDPVKALQVMIDWHEHHFEHWQESNGRMRYAGDPEKWSKLWKESLEIAKDPGHEEYQDVIDGVKEVQAKHDPKKREERLVAAKIAEEGEKARAKYEAQGVEIDPDEPAPLSKLRGKQVWLYHGTSSALLGAIKEQGLQNGNTHGRQSNVGSSGSVQATPDHVYLTARQGGTASADFYAKQAASAHGGDPVVVRVLVSADDLSYDPDDEDLNSGRYQYVTDSVPVEQIKEIDGERMGSAVTKSVDPSLAAAHSVMGNRNVRTGLFISHDKDETKAERLRRNRSGSLKRDGGIEFSFKELVEQRPNRPWNVGAVKEDYAMSPQPNIVHPITLPEDRITASREVRKTGKQKREQMEQFVIGEFATWNRSEIG